MRLLSRRFGAAFRAIVRSRRYLELRRASTCVAIVVSSAFYFLTRLAVEYSNRALRGAFSRGRGAFKRLENSRLFLRAKIRRAFERANGPRLIIASSFGETKAESCRAAIAIVIFQADARIRQVSVFKGRMFFIPLGARESSFCTLNDFINLY